MATRNFVPRANGEGSIGTDAKHWGSGNFDNINANAAALKNLNINGNQVSDLAKTLLGNTTAADMRSTIEATAANCGGIVSYSIDGLAGYVKFANKFIIEWDVSSIGNDTSAYTSFPVTLARVYACFAAYNYTSDSNRELIQPVGYSVTSDKTGVNLFVPKQTDKSQWIHVLVFGTSA